MRIFLFRKWDKNCKGCSQKCSCIRVYWTECIIQQQMLLLCHLEPSRDYLKNDVIPIIWPPIRLLQRATNTLTQTIRKIRIFSEIFSKCEHFCQSWLIIRLFWQEYSHFEKIWEEYAFSDDLFQWSHYE